ncbi:structural maintenance of chromosomes flexible hinge domain protein [Perilla frutescens var. frutescens]|nr:structural maintenance of chromosomes flexible hinge domain protein [Perilla frutescens var. frutescens]
MVVKMMRWRPWPPLISRKLEVRLTVQKLEGCDWVWEGAEKDNGGLAVEIRWKGPKVSLGTFRRTVKRNCTREEVVKRVGDGGPNDGVFVEWDEEFYSVCSFSGYKDNVFHPWEISFAVLQVTEGLNQGAKNKISVVGLGALNLAEYASKTMEQLIVVKIPLIVSNTAVEHHPSLSISLNLLELQGVQQSTELVPVMPVPPAPSSGEASSTDKDEVSALKAGLRKVKFFTEYVSTRRPRKACLEEEGSEGRYFFKSEDDEYAYLCDLDSPDEFEEGECDESKDCAVRKSFSYGTLAYANYAGVSCYSGATNHDGEDWIYYSNRRGSAAGCSLVEDPLLSAPEQSLIQNSKRSILPWRKRKLSFRSPKAKGEPLLKKANDEEGGDDIDFDRRQLSSDESLSPKWHRTDEDSNANQSSVSEFGDDSFAVGVWEQKEVTSRDGHMKIQTQVFFASIDQRSERAAGESACTVLVAVMADWLQNNRNLMPIKSQFDSLIRDGSLEWRNLCENETYKERFPDKHFDLETVLLAKIRDLCVVPGSSFIGFLHPDCMEGENFDFLRDAMSFDDIWDEISRSESPSGGEAPVFIVSWNDHFFVLKVETDAYYIVDTLGERLHEGCNQAYILKFDRNTAIYNLRHANQSTEEKSAESCKEYIKSFLAAIPIRELEADIKKGLTMSTPLHQRLQIEFHYTRLLQSASISHTTETSKGEVIDVWTPEVAV